MGLNATAEKDLLEHDVKRVSIYNERLFFILYIL